MSLKDVAGFNLFHCETRRNYLTYYATRSADTGNTLQFISRGTLCYKFIGGRLTAGENDIVCWNERELVESYPVNRKPVSFTVIGFDILSLSGQKLKLSDLDIPSLLRIKSPARVSSLLRRMRTLFSSRDTLRLFKCSRLGMDLLQILDREKRAGISRDAVSESGIHHRIKDALEYIYHNYKKRLDIETLASRACMHPDYFTRLFKRQIGISPSRYVQESKIRRAKDFLRMYDEPLAFTGEELGFHDYSHFYRTFKRLTRMTPRQFIKKNKRGYDPKQDEWNLQSPLEIKKDGRCEAAAPVKA
jgi:AraC-like DNA-binding protein